MEGTMGPVRLCPPPPKVIEILPVRYKNFAGSTQKLLAVLDVVPAVSGARMPAGCSTLRSPAKLSLMCLITQTTLKGMYLTNNQNS